MAFCIGDTITFGEGKKRIIFDVDDRGTIGKILSFDSGRTFRSGSTLENQNSIIGPIQRIITPSGERL
ncbi:MAG: hypothetical protein LBC22_01320 [Endomicrobium sp.]|nr:hypothetical protein [Endomicrobium sp.]